MPLQAPQWTDFLLCHVCCKQFDATGRQPVSLGCGHTVCQSCLSKLNRQQCPFDQAEIKTTIKDLPINYGLLQLVGSMPPESQLVSIPEVAEHQTDFDASRKWIESLTLYLKPLLHSSGLSNGSNNNQIALGNATFNGLTRQMQRKLVTLVNCQLVEEEGRSRAVRAARSLGERAVKELILLHQNPQQLSTNLWTAVRLRGCQFLGPAMQDEVLKIILLSLEEGSALCRKVLVLYVVQKLEGTFSQASKTSIGHVVQLLYRASCFKVTKREGESSLLQLQDKYRTFAALRKEHDAQIVKIAMEAGLHISPEQWSSLLYGDDEHKSHMQSIIDKLQTPESFGTSIHELLIALQKTGDPSDLQQLCSHLDRLAKIEPNPEGPPPTWDELEEVLHGLHIVIRGLVDFAQSHNYQKMKNSSQAAQSSYSKFKTRMCRDVKLGTCPRGDNCNFAHSEDEMKRHRRRRTPSQSIGPNGLVKPSSSPDGFDLQDDDGSDGKGYGGFYCRNEMPMQNGCSSDPVHVNNHMGQDVDHFNNGYGMSKPVGNVQVADPFASTRPLASPLDVSFSTASRYVYPLNNFQQPYAANGYTKRFEDGPAAGYCVQASTMPPVRQSSSGGYGMHPAVGNYPEMYSTVYPTGVLVPVGGGFGFRGPKEMEEKGEQNPEKWDFGSSGLPGLNPTLDVPSSSPSSQLLGSDSNSSWGSLFSGGKSDPVWGSSKETRATDRERDAWPPNYRLPCLMDPIGSRSSKESSTSSCPSSLEESFGKASLYD